MKSYTFLDMLNHDLWGIMLQDHMAEVLEDEDFALNILALNFHMIMNGYMAYDRKKRAFITLHDFPNGHADAR